MILILALIALVIFVALAAVGKVDWWVAAAMIILAIAVMLSTGAIPNLGR